MKNYHKPEYGRYRNWINNAINKRGKSWEEVRNGLRKSSEELGDFLSDQEYNNDWNISVEEWRDLVDLQQKAHEETLQMQSNAAKSVVLSKGEDNSTSIPVDEKSPWQLYKKQLLQENGFSEETVQNIEEDSFNILKKLSNNTKDTGPIKGLVVGNVQSGKTTNMAALISMAADFEWNVFIVLSGTIDNLRKQTEDRLYGDLRKTDKNYHWELIERASLRGNVNYNPEHMNFNGNTCYLNVCLKNVVRLKDLVKWIQSDSNKMKQMKILVIDDESDQASVNTSNLDNDEERKAINGLIVNLVEGNDILGKKANSHYGAMNYIGYTATPYANVLNESSDESLYPRDFIAMLNKSNEYFGPQEIFGVEGTDQDGLDIVRIIDTLDSDELQIIGDIHEGTYLNLPEKLKDAIAWFLNASASLRLYGYRNPVSMLVHTSNRQDHHDNLSRAITNWLKGNRKEVLEWCERTWNVETARFSLETFVETYENYGGDFESVLIPHSFEELQSTLQDITSEIETILLDSDGELEYHNGIHLCIDNSRYSKITGEQHFRLAYPTKRNKPAVDSPAFLVVGGATLSRGLTLEGLICSSQVKL